MKMLGVKLLIYSIGFIGLLTERMEQKLLSIKILERAKVIKTELVFCYYQVAKGID
ncbi:hypothetical protein KHQ81_12480 [Mycoplasmatota bacterium]|nr:hypothetical protein KHQ81_12480 [Mycoplasmatota bacterium]